MVGKHIKAKHFKRERRRGLPLPLAVGGGLVAAAILGGAAWGSGTPMAAIGANGTVPISSMPTPEIDEPVVNDGTPVQQAGAETAQPLPGPTPTPPSVDYVPPAPVIAAQELKKGSPPELVMQLEERLELLRFDVGARDGKYDEALTYAVNAFQRQQGLPRTGVADAATLNSLAISGLATPIIDSPHSNRVEIDKQRQIVQVWMGNKLTRVMPTSTGSEVPYCSKKSGRCGSAKTSVGTFKIYRKDPGVQVGPLGALWNPLYFNGGIALHGSPQVPNKPASHGCSRLPLNSTRWAYDAIPVGTTVYVTEGVGRPGLPLLPEPPVRR